MAKIHFEIQKYTGRKWTVVDVVDDQKNAIIRCKNIWSTQRGKPMRVIRERLDEASGTFGSSEIYHCGEKVEAQKDATENAKAQNQQHCWKVGDLYSYEGRRTIAETMGSLLARQNLTPTELLHNVGHYNRIEESGTHVQAAVQRVAVTQAATADISIQDRMRQIYDLIGQAASIVTRYHNENRVPVFKPDEFDQIVESLNSSDERVFLLLISTAMYLEQDVGLLGKFSKVIAVLRPQHPSWVRRALDGFLAECLQSKKVIAELLGNRNDTLSETLTLVSMLSGELETTGEHAEVCGRINEHFAAKSLPATMREVEKRLIATMERRDRFDENDLESELANISKISKAFGVATKENEFKTKLRETLEQRCERVLSKDAIEVFLRDIKDPLERLNRLCSIEPMATGDIAKRLLGDAIKRILSSEEYEKDILKAVGPVTKRLKRLSLLQEKIGKTDLDEEMRDRFVQRFDDLAWKMIKSMKFFEKFGQAPGDKSEKAHKLLAMLADRYFTKGVVDEHARQHLKRYMQGSKFIEYSIQKAGSAEEKAIALKMLMDQLVAAGMAGPGGIPTGALSA
ncbi:MAG: hypothetical protein AAGF15_10115 [Pseudomonadota bacterium]